MAMTSCNRYAWVSAMPPCSLPQETVRVCRMAQCERYQPQTDRPALDFLLQVGQRVVAGGKREQCLQQCPGLGVGETQVCQPDLGAAGMREQSGQPERRIAPGNDHQMQQPWRVRQQQAHERVDLGVAADSVVVVQDQHQGRGQRVQLIDQGARQDGRGRWLGRSRQAPGLPAGPRDNRLDGGQQVVDEQFDGTVRGVQRQPGAGDALRRCPMADQQALAISRRRRNQGQRQLQAQVHQVVQARSTQEIPGHDRAVQFGPQQGVLDCLGGFRHRPPRRKSPGMITDPVGKTRNGLSCRQEAANT